MSIRRNEVRKGVSITHRKGSCTYLLRTPPPLEQQCFWHTASFLFSVQELCYSYPEKVTLVFTACLLLCYRMDTVSRQKESTLGLRYVQQERFMGWKVCGAQPPSPMLSVPGGWQRYISVAAELSNTCISFKNFLTQIPSPSLAVSLFHRLPFTFGIYLFIYSICNLPNCRKAQH